MTNYLEELNESQRNAVLYNEGPSLVIAGAGSGKTRVLTYKIAYLLERGYTPWSILALKTPIGSPFAFSENTSFLICSLFFSIKLFAAHTMVWVER
jgi:hypothetical protein